MRKLSNLAADYMVNTLKMPKDFVYGSVMLSVTGRQEAYIENYKSIIEYSDTQIKLQIKNGKLVICGKNLRIEYYTCEEMKIVGLIEEIKYE
jgi:sporulation protein YqfC